MVLKLSFLAAGFAFSLASGCLADEATIVVEDAYVRSSGPSAVTAAAFMHLRNTGVQDDLLVSARSGAAERVELHTHMENANGVMEMRAVEGGLAVPAGGTRDLARGGDHLMFLGLTGPLVQGESVPIILTFEKAGEIEVDLKVDPTR